MERKINHKIRWKQRKKNIYLYCTLKYNINSGKNIDQCTTLERIIIDACEGNKIN